MAGAGSSLHALHIACLLYNTNQESVFEVLLVTWGRNDPLLTGAKRQMFLVIVLVL